jgi:hypothetical protein
MNFISGISPSKEKFHGIIFHFLYVHLFLNSNKIPEYTDEIPTSATTCQMHAEWNVSGLVNSTGQNFALELILPYL